MTATTVDAGPAAALRQMMAFTPRQAVFSAIHAMLFLAVALYRHDYGWMALFAALLLQCALTFAVLFLLRLLLPRNASWLWCWGTLPFALLIGACVTVQAYHMLTAPWALLALSAPQMLIAALVFGGAVIAVPLVHARRQASALQLAELRQAALSAELKSLQAQVEPHFLYNTLANTRYLMRHEPEKAVQMLDHLIAYLRTALPDMRAPMSTARREMELAAHYLALMGIRYGVRLSVSIDCPPALGDVQMPPLMLMSLVENAVQHGLEPKPGPVHIGVRAWRDLGDLCVSVSDTGAGLGGTVLGSGVGLRNVRERLSALYGDKASFKLSAGAGEGATTTATEAVLRLPLQREAA